jgi:hypothetical protein
MLQPIRDFQLVSQGPAPAAIHERHAIVPGECDCRLYDYKLSPELIGLLGKWLTPIVG